MKCSWVKCSESLGNMVSNVIRRCIDHMKFAAFVVFFFVYHIPSCSFGSIFIILYMVVYFVYLCLIL